jgi:hypothetical protein
LGFFGVIFLLNKTLGVFLGYCKSKKKRLFSSKK